MQIFVIDQLEGIDGASEYFFHALMRGALPLIPPSNYLVEIFGKESSIFYKSREQLVQKCRFYLENPVERSSLVEQLQRQVPWQAFSWFKLAQKIVSIFNE